MDFLELLKDIVAMVVVGNAVTGNLNNTEEKQLKIYKEILLLDDAKSFLKKLLEKP